MGAMGPFEVVEENEPLASDSRKLRRDSMEACVEMESRKDMESLSDDMASLREGAVVDEKDEPNEDCDEVEPLGLTRPPRRRFASRNCLVMTLASFLSLILSVFLSR